MQTEIPNISVHAHPSKFVLKPSRDEKGRGNSAITLNSSQLAEHEVLMPLSMALCFYGNFLREDFTVGKERQRLRDFRNALLIDLLHVGQFL